MFDQTCENTVFYHYKKIITIKFALITTCSNCYKKNINQIQFD